MPLERLSRFFLLPNLKLTEIRSEAGGFIYTAVKETEWEVCTKCPTKCFAVYDTRVVHIKDAPIRGRNVTLEIRKRRFRCPSCKNIFTEPVDGIRRRARTSERFKRSLLWACDTFADMKKVRKEYRCSNNTLYRIRFEELARLEKQRDYQQWPTAIGIDEHGWKRNKKLMCTDFVTMIVDHKRKRAVEIVRGKSTADLELAMAHLPGRENVRAVTLDLCDPFAAFTRKFFPNAQLVADKFHVLRLLTPHINRRRKEITGDKRTFAVRKLLLRSGYKLDYFKQCLLKQWLMQHPTLEQLYLFKERMHQLYRIRGYDRAAKAHQKLVDDMALCDLPEIKTLRKTIIKWKIPILNYFKTGLTNARLEGFNNVAKTVKKRAYGIRSFRNYQLLLKNACYSRTG